MIRSPGRLPDRGTSDFKPDRDFGKLGSDRLMFDERPPSLYAQVRKVECGFVGCTPNSEIQRLEQRRAVARDVDASQQRGRIVAEKIGGGHRAIFEGHIAATTMRPWSLVCSYRYSRRIRRNQQDLGYRPSRYFDQDRKQRGDWRVGHVVLDAIDDPLATSCLYGECLGRYVGRSRAMIVQAKPCVSLGFIVCKGEMEAVIPNES